MASNISTITPIAERSSAAPATFNSRYTQIDANFIALQNALGPDVTSATYGAVGNGTTDDTAAFQAAIAAGSGRRIRIPAGNYLITSTLTVSTADTHFIGEGTGATILTFKPSVTGRRLFALSAGAVPLYRNKFEGMTVAFHSSASTLQKIAFELLDTGSTEFQDVFITGCHGSSGATDSNGMLAAPSTGFLIKGRELPAFKDVTNDADLPIHISVNPNFATLNCDHLNARTYYSLCNDANGAHILIDPTVLVTTINFEGAEPWVQGKYGIFKKDADGSATRSYQISARNVRMEQATAGGYLCYWVGNVANMMWENCQPPVQSNGWYVRYCQSLVLNGNLTTNPSGENLNIDSTVIQCSGLGNDWADSSTVSLGTNVAHLEAARSSTKPLGGSFIIGPAAPFTRMNLSTPTLTTPHVTGMLRFDDSLPLLKGGATGLSIRDTTEANDNLFITNGGSVKARTQMMGPAGSAILPGLAISSESSLGLFRSGVSTLTPSYGTFDLASTSVRLSMRTLAASSVTASAANAVVAQNEVVFTIGGASGASLCISSGGTTYIFNSAISAKNT